MHLLAALLPPVETLERVRAVAASVAPVADTPTGGAPGRHLADSVRRFGRRRAQPSVAPPRGPMLDLLPLDVMHLPVAKLGNLALTDATRLADALEVQAMSWAPPELTLSGGVALEPTGDDSVWVRMGGDLDALGEIVRDVGRVAQGLYYFVDRRAFRPQIRLGRVNDLTTTAYLEQLLSVLDAYHSTPWRQTRVALITPSESARSEAFKTFRELTVGPATP